MTGVQSGEGSAWSIPAQALTEWLALADVIEREGPVPCECSDAEAWWPVRPRDVSEVVLRACRACPARAACLDYAVAADEDAGIWGGMLPADRRPAKAA